MSVQTSMSTDTEMTIKTALQQATEQLAASSDSSSLDAHYLLAFVLGQSQSYLIAHARDPLDGANYTRFSHLIERRLTGEPVAYLLGQKGFWTFNLAVSNAVLVPRPETETLIEAALMRLPANASATIADLGTGSGAIALALASERPDCHVIATDLDKNSLTVARDNSRQLGLSQVEFRQGAWFAPLANARFDLIASNPPYVAPDDPHLTALGHEPRAALVTGEHGRACLRHLIEQACDYLKPDGWLLLEHGFDQGPFVRDSMANAGFGNVATQPDLAGQPRVTTGQRLT